MIPPEHIYETAQIAGVSRWDMRDVLIEAGLDLRLGPRDMEELQQEVDVAMDLGEESDKNDE